MGFAKEAHLADLFGMYAKRQNRSKPSIFPQAYLIAGAWKLTVRAEKISVKT